MVSRYVGTSVSRAVPNFNISNKSGINEKNPCFAPNYLVPLQCIRMTHNERLERTHAAFRKNTASNQEERSREN